MGTAKHLSLFIMYAWGFHFNLGLVLYSIRVSVRINVYSGTLILDKRKRRKDYFQMAAVVVPMGHKLKMKNKRITKKYKKCLKSQEKT